MALASFSLGQTPPPAPANSPAPAKPAATATAKDQTAGAAAQPLAAAHDTPAPPALQYSGLLDVYWGYNFNKPARSAAGNSVTGPGMRNFDYKNDQFALGLAEFGITRPTTDTSRVGFTIKLAYGPTADLLTSPGDADNKNILQAYGTYAIPAGKDKTITVDAGKFVTNMGYEVIEPSGNANFSRSDLFQFFIPYYHAGVRAAIPLTPTLTGNVYIYNGWNDVSFDTNSNKAIGAGVTLTPNANNSFTLQGLSSREPAGADDQPKTTLEFIGTHNFSPTFSGALDLNYDFGKASAAGQQGGPITTSDWSAWGAAAYLKWSLPSGSYFALRGEYAKDKDGFIFGIGDSHVSEITATYSWQSPLYPNSELRLEFRHDDASANGLFIGSDGLASKSKQDTFTISHIVKF